MPIYAYRCSNCGHQQDVLQKMSDAVLTLCPACGHSTYVKQVTAAGFQLKGSGWYVTDFRGDGKAAKTGELAEGVKVAKEGAEKSGDSSAAEKGGESGGSGEGKKGDGKTGESAPGKAESAPSPAPAPSAAAGSPAPASAPSGTPSKTGKTGD